MASYIRLILLRNQYIIWFYCFYFLDYTNWSSQTVYVNFFNNAKLFHAYPILLWLFSILRCKLFFFFKYWSSIFFHLKLHLCYSVKPNSTEKKIFRKIFVLIFILNSPKPICTGRKTFYILTKTFMGKSHKLNSSVEPVPNKFVIFFNAKHWLSNIFHKI